MEYKKFFTHQLDVLKSEGRYRVFTNVRRTQDTYPTCTYKDSASAVWKDVTIWCSNDYMAMGQKVFVHEAMKEAIDSVGSGAGGTRNLSGTTPYHVRLEQKISSWYGKQNSLIFTSGYVANFTTLGTLGEKLPNCIIYSDAMNHNSIIEGIRRAKTEKRIFKHNDVQDLERLLQQEDESRAKIIAFESLYSMDGDIAPIKEIVHLAKKYNALTFLDEVHAVGLYGDKGSGIAEKLGLRQDIDVIQGTLGKAVGQIGGFITGEADIIDFIRSYGAGFIFTTSLPPCVVSGAIVAIEYLKGAREERQKVQNIACALKAEFLSRKIPIILSESHIVPVLIGNASLCQRISDILLSSFGIYVQAVNYPTVSKGGERLRFSPSPLHTQYHVQRAGEAVETVFTSLNLL